MTEATAALPALRIHATAPAGPEGVQRVVKSRFATFPQTERWADEDVLFWRDWYIACADLTEEALEAGMTAWLRRSPAEKWLPKPGELREMASQVPTRSAEAYRRARAAAELNHERQQPPKERALAEDVKSMMATFYAGSKGRQQSSRMVVASVLEEDPIDHTARIQAEHRQLEATIAFNQALADAEAVRLDAKPEHVDAARAAVASRFRALADSIDARKRAAQPTAHDQAA